MKRPWQPEWASEEESKIAQEWSSLESKMDIDEYIRANASDRLLKEYERQKELRKDMRFGHEILPDGDIVVYN